MRAVQPTQSGVVKAAGFQIEYDVFGAPGAPALLLLPAWQILDRRLWKMQVAGLAHAYRVITFDGPRRADDPQALDKAAFEFDRIVDQGIELLDFLGVERAAVAGFSRSCAYAITMAARYPQRVVALVLITNGVTPDSWGHPPPRFRERLESYTGWEKYNLHYWREDYEDWIQFLFGEVFSEPHSSKPFEDALSWARETTPEILGLSEDDPALMPRMPVEDAIAAVQCPVLMIHGDDSRCTPIHCSLELSSLRSDWPMVILEGSGQAPQLRDPVRVNLVITDFLRQSGVDLLAHTRKPAPAMVGNST